MLKKRVWPHLIRNRIIRYLRFSGGIALLSLDLLAECQVGLRQTREMLHLISEQIVALGVRSFSLVTLASAAIGAVMALQFGNGLKHFGGGLYVPQVVGVAILRELGPVLTGLLLAGKVGSGITSEIASMKVSEQFDALRALGASPLTVVVIPRIIACTVIFPALTLFGDYVSLLSALFMTHSELSLDPVFYLTKTINGVTLEDLGTGLVKASVFGLFVGIAACWKGITTSGGTRGIGISTNWTVVRTSIFILLSDFFLSKLFILTVLKDD